MSNSLEEIWDAVIIGGGFYGVAIAAYLSRIRQLPKVLLVEQEDKLMTRASYNNQARVHNGYHYPRSFTTAYRSRINMPQFLNDWPDVVYQDFTKLYAIARRNSKVTAKQFQRFCQEIWAKFETADPSLKALFNPKLIEDVFLVQEYAFDAKKLGDWAKQELDNCGVPVYYNTSAIEIHQNNENTLRVIIESTGEDRRSQLISQSVYNCTYSGMNQIKGAFSGTQTRLKHEIAELALVDLPPPLNEIGITVMDGAFSLSCHSPREVYILYPMFATHHITHGTIIRILILTSDYESMTVRQG
jgi:glycine/D-amino acid oxidase-like deaminating enzyme